MRSTIVTPFEDRDTVRLITEDAGLLVPALLQRDVSVRLTGSRHVDVQGMGAADIARVAALHNARVTDLETVRTPAGLSENSMAAPTG